MLALFLAVDWACCRVLAWRLSNTLDSHFCVEALKVAFAQYGDPEIFNADQGAQFTLQTFPQALKDAKIIISICP
jgi:putative transposase